MCGQETKGSSPSLKQGRLGGGAAGASQAGPAGVVFLPLFSLHQELWDKQGGKPAEGRNFLWTWLWGWRKQSV